MKYITHTVNDLKLDVLHWARFHFGGVYVERMAYCKTKTEAGHEFSVIHVRDKMDSSKNNVMILDGAGTTRPTVEGVLRWLDRVLEGEPGSGPNPFDRFVISTSNGKGTLCTRRNLKKYREIETLRIDHQDLTIEKLVVLGQSISAHGYSASDNRCFWYTGVVWEIACALAYPDRRSIKKGTNGPPGWSTIKPSIPEADRLEALRPIFDWDWKSFCVQVEERRIRWLAAQDRVVEKRVRVSDEKAEEEPEPAPRAMETAQRAREVAMREMATARRAKEIAMKGVETAQRAMVMVQRARKMAQRDRDALVVIGAEIES
ncbi:hypothetical protein FRC10_010416 [Ceratobasidium sp. 414]|nr:hypothetical protein FRC10_010416 [Ceratobasidium sp. 414]